MANSSCYTRAKFNIIYIIGRKILFFYYFPWQKDLYLVLYFRAIVLTL